MYVRGRARGLSDRDVLDVNQVTGYFAYVNRVADGLGVVTDALLPRRHSGASSGPRERAHRSASIKGQGASFSDFTRTSPRFTRRSEDSKPDPAQSS